MSTNWNTVQLIRNVEAGANSMGFELAPGRDTWGSNSGTLIYVVPLDDKLPHYSRGAEIFQGTIEDISIWLKGIRHAREYDEMIKLSNNTKRIEREQIECNRQLMQMVKTGKKIDGAYVGEATDNDLDHCLIWVDPILDTDNDIPF
jgi:hypothetical protein